MCRCMASNIDGRTKLQLVPSLAQGKYCTRNSLYQLLVQLLAPLTPLQSITMVRTTMMGTVRQSLIASYCLQRALSCDVNQVSLSGTRSIVMAQQEPCFPLLEKLLWRYQCPGQSRCGLTLDRLPPREYLPILMTSWPHPILLSHLENSLSPTPEPCFAMSDSQ